LTLLSRPRHRDAWNADDVDTLCAMFSLNKPVRDIARHLGRSQEAINAKARQLGRFEGPSL